jgi:hypothetical protein
MADAMETLKGILGDDAEDKLKNVMSSFSGGNADGMQDNSLEYIMQMKDIMSKLANNRDDPRSNLLMSLRPYMRSGRRQSIDNAVRLFNLTKLSGILRQK